MTDPEPHGGKQALRVLSEQPDPEARRTALAMLIAECSPSTLVSESAVRKAVLALGDNSEGKSEIDRLKDICLLAQLSTKVREFRKLGEVPLKHLLAFAPASLSLIDDKKIQLLVTNLLAQRRTPWLADYLAHEATSNTVSAGDKPRTTMVVGLFRNTSTWTDAIARLCKGLQEFLSSPERSDHDAIDLVRSNLLAMRAGIERTALEPGNDVGQPILELVETLQRRSVSGNKDLNLRAKLVGEVAAFVNMASCLHPTLLASRALISALTRARGLASRAGGSWPPPAVRFVTAVMVRLRNGIAMCGRHGIADRDLFDNLELLAGSRDGALKYTRSIAIDIQGLPQSVQTWLLEGNFVADSSGILGDSDDSAIAVLLLRAKEYEDQLHRATNRKGSGESTRGSGHEFDKPDERFQDFGSVLATEAIALAHRRQLRTDGVKGEIVPYQPLQHRLTRELSSKSNKVRILVPAVVRRRDDGGTTVILPAVADPYEGSKD